MSDEDVDNLFEAVAYAQVTWLEPPAITLSDWRVRIAAQARADATVGAEAGRADVQVEFLRTHGGRVCSLIVSPIDATGARGREFVIYREQLRALRALLNASDLSDDGPCSPR